MRRTIAATIAAAYRASPTAAVQLARDHLPGSRLDVDESRVDRLVFRADGRRIIVTACLAAGIVVTVKGSNTDNARARLRNAFQVALESELAPDVGEDLPREIAQLVGVVA